ncbi:MAG: TPM domain-containing protein [Pseudomonadota bacterium]
MLLRLAAALILLTTQVMAQTYPDYTELYVNDFAGLISEDREDALRKTLRDLRSDDGVEFTVVTIERMSDYGHDGPIEPFATGLFNYWGVGNAERNDGVMLLVSRYDRHMRIELGAGYGRRYDAAMQDVVDNFIIPRFKQDDYQTGIEDGVAETILALSEEPLSDTERFFASAQRVANDPQPWWMIFLAPIAGAGWWVNRRWRRNRPRYCPNDGTRMVRLDEFADDLHLVEGQNLEERLESVDYDVWRCERCHHVTVEAYRRWFSGFGACPACNYRTLEGEETVIRAATTSRSGFKRIDYTCLHCQHTYSETRTIPKRSKSSSSGSSSSFGGGSSGGGGASGSW